MNKKQLEIPFTLDDAETIAAQFGTPVYLYDEAGIRRTAAELQIAFAWAKGYKNYFAVKATPTPGILRVLADTGMGFDCSTRSELVIMQRMGISGRDIFYSSNNTPRDDFELALELGATVNIDDLSQVSVYIDALAGGHADRVSVRYNPGDLKKGGNALIGTPTEAKYGMSLDAATEAFKLLKNQDIGSFGLHTMVVSNELIPEYFGETAELLLDAVTHLEKLTGVAFDFINLGGGFGLNYRPHEAAFDSTRAVRSIQKAVEAFPREIEVYSEHGRYVTGPHGYLLSQVRYVMHKHKTYLGLDASMHNLMRPGMYGAYHHLTILGREAQAHDHIYDVVGALCENNDKFAIDRALPEAEAGDYVVIHDVGAHGHAMGFNYNGLLRSPEVLMQTDGSYKVIRKGETVDDHLRNIIW